MPAIAETVGGHAKLIGAQVPGLHLLWMPLGPAGTRTNYDSPGIQFYIGNLQYFERSSEPEISSYLSALAARANDDDDKPDSEGFLYRPKMEIGDLVVFSGAVPHASFAPKGAWSRRDSCDIRVFPWTDENYMPPAAIANGQRQAPLY
jgi:hypothetical protein